MEQTHFPVPAEGACQRPLVAVVGACNLDIGGRPTEPLVSGDSRPGTVMRSPGGVGRNIAHNLALLGAQVQLFTVLGDDAGSADLRLSCVEVGIDTSASPALEGESCATYLFLAHSTGEMAYAVSDMDICERMTPSFLAPRMEAINRAALCVTDTNLPAESLLYLAEHCRVPLFADPVSITKTQRLHGLLPLLHTLKPNRIEAELLTGFPIRDEAELARAARALLDMGLRQVFITLGADGAFAADRETAVRLPNVPGALANTTGAGDAFTAALAYAYLRGWPADRAARAGLAAAAINVASSHTINPALSAETLQAKMAFYDAPT